MNKTINYQVGDRPASIEAQAAGIKQLYERIEKENEAKSTTEVVLDKSNKVSFPGYPYRFEALGEKILVSIDVFKSGYECKTCKGKKTLETKCVCEDSGHAGLKYSDEDLRIVAETLGEDVALSRQGLVCSVCNGEYQKYRSKDICPDCKGKGAILHLPDDSKKLPTTGVVVSMGESCKGNRFKIGDRILFGPYAGNMIPTKAGLMFKIIDEVQAWCRIEGGEDMAAFDFIIQEKE